MDDLWLHHGKVLILCVICFAFFFFGGGGGRGGGGKGFLEPLKRGTFCESHCIIAFVPKFAVGRIFDSTAL